MITTKSKVNLADPHISLENVLEKLNITDVRKFYIEIFIKDQSIKPVKHILENNMEQVG
jgi:hypothetical protein